MLSEGGVCFGWYVGSMIVIPYPSIASMTVIARLRMNLYDRQLHSIGKSHELADGTLYAIVTVVRERESINTGNTWIMSDKSEETVKDWDQLSTVS